MRLKNENERFREQLAKFTALLNTASLNDLDRVASEVGRAIGSLLNEHRQEALRIENAYRPKFGALAAAGWLTASVFAVPCLAPLFSAVPPFLLTKQYVETKLNQRREKEELVNSLLGILAAAEGAPDNLE